MSRLEELMQEARETGGFYYATCDSPGNMHQVLDSRRLRLAQDSLDIQETFFVQNSCLSKVVANFIEGSSHYFNEAVIYGGFPEDHKIKKRLFGLIKKRELLPPPSTADLFTNGTSEEACVLNYEVAREEPDKAGRPGYTISYVLVSSKRIVEGLVEELKKQPGKVSELFKGIFPEKRFHGVPNGKIVFMPRNELSNLNRMWENCPPSEEIFAKAAPHLIEYQTK